MAGFRENRSAKDRNKIASENFKDFILKLRSAFDYSAIFIFAANWLLRQSAARARVPIAIENNNSQTES